uniref:Uncharacterized protein n=1 Tax=Sphaerodactylus townsendi TaxID=933632 RepID=A0ACB8EMM6_9SAUR
MAARNVLLTGCSSGIGRALAVRLAKDELKRFRVIATMRNLEKKEALEKEAGPVLEETLEIKELDVGSEDSIRRCLDSIPQRRVDVLGTKASLLLLCLQESPPTSFLDEQPLSSSQSWQSLKVHRWTQPRI